MKRLITRFCHWWLGLRPEPVILYVQNANMLTLEDSIEYLTLHDRYLEKECIAQAKVLLARKMSDAILPHMAFTISRGRDYLRDPFSGMLLSALGKITGQLIIAKPTHNKA